VHSDRQPLLARLYHRYLEDENSAAFVAAVSRHYLPCSLERLASGGDHVARRASIMALGFLGDYTHNAVLGRALIDRDRGVRLLADNGIRALWRRDGNLEHRQQLARICRLNCGSQYDEAVDEANVLIDDAPWFAEAWNQRGIGLFAQRRFDAAANDCQQTLELNPFHFGAAVGMAHCYLELDEPMAALENFRRAIQLHPDLEDVRVQIDYLQRTLEGK
jgi:tetratricopeptide (TPR) repeat protein